MTLARCLFTTAIAIATAITATTASAQVTGPSTHTEPYVVPTHPGVATVSILTAGDAVRGYRMVGVPDGGGAWRDHDDRDHDDRDHDDRDHGDRDHDDRDHDDRDHDDRDHDDRGDFELVINHELGRTAGVTRANGSTGSFVSRWTIDGDTFRVRAGRDHNRRARDVETWNGTRYVAGPNAVERLCSGDLADPRAYRTSRLGTSARIYLSGEETSPPFTPDHGRVFAHVVTGADRDGTYELPRLGKMAVENAVASPFPQAKTVVMIDDDSNRATGIGAATVCRMLGQTGCDDPPSELFVYVGAKQDRGNAIERAGLTNGRLYGVRVVRPDGTRVTGESVANVFGSVGFLPDARFELVAVGDDGDVSRQTGVQLQDDAIENQITQFIRIEDGAWDPRPGHQGNYYFLTTGRITTSEATWRPSRLWQLHFDDITRPERGGTIEMVLTNAFHADNVGDPGYQMLDNLAIDRLGRAIMQEDVGNNPRLGRIYVYDLDGGGPLVQVAVHNPRFFAGTAATNPTFLTSDEESSGVFDAADILGRGWFLLTSQSHAPSADPALVESGQILGMYIDPSVGRD